MSRMVNSLPICIMVAEQQTDERATGYLISLLRKEAASTPATAEAVRGKVDEMRALYTQAEDYFRKVRDERRALLQ
jgi:hypothetical protein